MTANRPPEPGPVPGTLPSALLSEETVTFAELARRLKSRRAGRPTHVSTIHRWRVKGVHGVRLAAAKAGGIWVTTAEAYERFVAAVTRAADPTASVETGVGGHGRAVDRRLDELGI